MVVSRAGLLLVHVMLGLACSVAVPAWSQSGSALVPGTATDGVVEAASVPIISTAVLSAKVVFDYKSYRLSDRAVATLNKLIDDLDGFVAVESVKVIGHTDNRASTRYNQQLSERRAQYIARFFTRRFPLLTVVVVGAGELSPVASNDTEAGRLRNRRVEIQVVAKGQKP